MYWNFGENMNINLSNLYTCSLRSILFSAILISSAPNVLHAFTLQEASIDAPCERPTAIFHLASSQNRIFDEKMIQKIISCAQIITLNIRIDSENQNFSLNSIRNKIFSYNPDLPVLSYFRVTRWKENTIRADGNILSDIGEHESWALNSSKKKGRKVVFTDFRNEEFIDWLVQKITDFTLNNGFNGVFIDALQRSPKGLCQKNTKECEKYQKGIDSFLIKLKERINNNNNRIVLFNGVYSDNRISRQDSARMLELSDGAMIEHFGLIKKNRKNANKIKPNFLNDIKFYQNYVDSNPEKVFGIFGRENYLVNTKTDKDWAGYLYAAYLMIKRENVHFKFHSSFQIPSKNDMTNGLYVVPESRLNIGSPVTPYEQTGCVQRREFENYIVALCDFDSFAGGTVEMKISQSDDNSKLCKIDLQPGEVIFMDKSDSTNNRCLAK